MSHIEFEAAYAEVVDSGWTSTRALAQAIWQKARSLPVGVPDVLFDGFAVLNALSDKARARTSSENVSDVLDAVVKLIREEAAAAPTVKAEQADDFELFWSSELRDELRKSCARGWAELIWKAATAAARFNFAYDASQPAAGSAVEAVESPQYHREALPIDSDTRARFTRIAREAAISNCHRYSYMPTTPEEAVNWHPHSWVVDAMYLVQRDALSALSAQQSAPVCWVNDQQLLLCSKSPREVEPGNPMRDGLPRNIAGSALPTEYCNTPLYRGVQQSAPERVSVPVELAERLAVPAPNGKGWTTWNAAVAYEAAKELRAILESHAEGGKV